jgi:DNA-3-methyladenine glycosylase
MTNIRGKSVLSQSFYNRDTNLVARELLGTTLVHIDNGKRISGMIIETEAYCGEDDLACHAKAGNTPRTEVMYGPPGHAFVYLTYGMHWMFCAVTQPIGQPDAVLIRAVTPIEGIETIAQRRGNKPENIWTDGPGKLSQAFGFLKEDNGLSLFENNGKIFIEEGIAISDKNVTTGPRVGLNTVPEPWFSMPWRYLVSGL